MARGLPTTGVSTGGGAIRLGEQTMKRHVSDHPCPRPGCGGSALYQWDSDEGPHMSPTTYPMVTKGITTVLSVARS